MQSRTWIPAFVGGLPTKISNLIAKIENHRLFARVPRKLIRPGLAILFLLILGSAIYFPVTTLTSKNTATVTQALQTAVVRQGDLIIYASGTGTLIAQNQVDLAFATGGQVKDIKVAVGDQVKAGDLLAEVNDTDAQIKLTQAKRSLMELTSPAAIASAQEAIAAAQTSLDSANNHLAYLISPEVFHWELEVKKAQQAVDEAKTAADAAPSNTDLQKKLKDAQAYLDFANDKLKGSKDFYKHNYLPNNFTVFDRASGTKYVAAPTDSEILQARAAVTQAEATLQEANYLYATLTGGDVPADATGSGLTDLETAKLNLESAQSTLDGTHIVSPINGTVMAIDTSVGDTVGSSTTVMTVADLSQPTLDVYLDESDWNHVKVGYEADVTFDILPDKKFTGKVIRVDPGLTNQSNTSVVHAVVTLDNIADPFNLPLGTSAAVDVIGGQAQNAVLVPVEALHPAGDQYTVFVVENGKLKLRVVQVGIQDQTFAEIKSGLKPGEVVSTGVTQTSNSQSQAATP